MPTEGGPPAYRIERHAPGVLHLFRGTDLMDIDREADDDTREDIERWGTGVAWAEDHTAIERWETNEEDAGWRVLVGVPYRYVTWRIEEDDVTVWDEIDSTGWVTRRVEATRRGQVYTAAASLGEALAARDAGGVEAVRAYEHVHGVLPEAAYPPDATIHLTAIGAREFVERWISARRELNASRDLAHWPTS